MGVLQARPRSARLPLAPARDRVNLTRRLTAELIGSALLAALVIGSGIAAQRLSPTDTGLQLLENAFATALGLPVLILIFGPVSGAHFNPVVSLVDSLTGMRAWRDTALYIPTQIVGCIVGAVLANIMFASPAVTISTTDRLTPATFLSEIVATAGLILVIFVLARTDRAHLTPAAVGAYIGAAYFFTSSASFANPAITIGRIFSDTFAGIAPTSAPGFIAAQLIGAGIGLVLIRFLYPVKRITVS
ncbi:MAG: aquaporin family protein [Leifsonia sp.]|nr:aquaporin family protein [Leifsonia sp.]